jgi:hypothetical protein
VHLPSPAYAVALQSLEDDSLYADTIMIGLEPDREVALARGRTRATRSGTSATSRSRPKRTGRA